ncbi:hypothetical protein GMDG_04991 [Pseudogymnoascus destructans 20631-21]|uniref:Uncharacterized protein n=2 Tax=Pseudogymnoascus destructans TaxID=655981 RepID=L8GDE3_PSED2|nr:hypothetical protein GMDG_04991 [Pseudogymnoascus destructans 20631-21]
MAPEQRIESATRSRKDVHTYLGYGKGIVGVEADSSHIRSVHPNHVPPQASHTATSEPQSLRPQETVSSVASPAISRTNAPLMLLSRKWTITTPRQKNNGKKLWNFNRMHPSRKTMRPRRRLLPRSTQM